MARLEARLDRLEQRSPPAEVDRITEIHRVIVNPDRTPAMKADGTPWVIITKVPAC